MRYTLWRRYASDVEESERGASERDSSEAASSESAALCALSSSNGHRGSSKASAPLNNSRATSEKLEEHKGEESSSSGSEGDSALKPTVRTGSEKRMVAWKGSLTRGARGLVARVRSIEQSVEELKERLFFDGEEHAARVRELEALIDALDEAADAIEDDEFAAAGADLMARVATSSAIVGNLWRNSDDLADRVRERCADFQLRDPRGGFAADVGVQRVGANGDPALRGQFECVAKRRVQKDATAPYPGVVVASLDEQRTLLGPLRPIDRTKWACFSYSFSTQLQTDDAEFCTELWPVLDAPTTFVNDACGPVDRSAGRMADKQNVEYVETLAASSREWRVDVRATRDIQPGEPLLADYGDAYWQNWKEHVHTRAMKRLDQRIADVYAMRVQEGKHRARHKSARQKSVRIETRVDAWLNSADRLHRHLNGLPPPVDKASPTRSGSKRGRAPTRFAAPPESSASTVDAAASTSRSGHPRDGSSSSDAPQRKRCGRAPPPRPAATRRPSWRDKLGKRVVAQTSRGYRQHPGVAVRVATERDAYDPMLQALYEQALAGPALFEAWWTDGQPYPLLTLDPRPPTAADLWGHANAFDVHFIDGEVAAVERVAPILKPNVWRQLERLPIGAWCRPTAKPNNWGVVVAYSCQNAKFTYHVRLDADDTTVSFGEDKLEPILIVRGISEADGSNWQEAFPVSILTDLGDPKDRCAFGA